MSGKFYPSIQPQQHVRADTLEQHLNLRLKDINRFNISIRNIKDIKNVYNHEAKTYKHKSEIYQLINF